MRHGVARLLLSIALAAVAAGSASAQSSREAERKLESVRK